MGFLDFFGGGDPQKQIDRIKRRLLDQYRQSYERYEAMDELTKLGSPQALDALLQRFTLHVSGPTVDEEEKQHAHEQIAKWGDAAIEPLKRFIATHDAVYFPLKSLRELAGDEVAVDALLEAIASADPGYHQGLERLREIVSNLRDFRHDRVRDALIGLLHSRNSEIRFYALDGLAGYPPAEVAPHFAERITDASETARVKALAYELALEHALPLQPWADAVKAALPPTYRLDDNGAIVRA
jgi:hypothetical protein